MRYIINAKGKNIHVISTLGNIQIIFTENHGTQDHYNIRIT